MEFGRSFSLASSKAMLAACVLGLLVSSGASMPASDVTTTTATISDLEKASGETVKTGMEVLEKYVVSLPFLYTSCNCAGLYLTMFIVLTECQRVSHS